MSLHPVQLRAALEAVHHVPTALWDARNLEQLEWAAADALTEVWAWTMPGSASPYGSAYSHARGSLVAYVLGSTYRLRRAELRDIAAARR